MKKMTLALLATSGLLSACSTMNSMQGTLANMEMQKRQLANGSTVFIDFNLSPTAVWGFHPV